MKNTIVIGASNYLKENADLIDAGSGGFSELKSGKELVLYAHGSEITFGKMKPAEIVAFLVETKKLPEGARTIFLKGCNSERVASAVQQLITEKKGYEEVIVRGTQGTARTTTGGASLVLKNKDSGKANALADIAKRRKLKQGASEAEAESTAKEVRGGFFKKYSTRPGQTRSGTDYADKH